HGRQGLGRRAHARPGRGDDSRRGEPHRRVGLGGHRLRGGAMKVERVILIVMDSVGCGELPDAPSYGDQGSDTLGNTARAVGAPTRAWFQRHGLGNLTTILGVPPAARPAGAYGKMREVSAGKDTTTGHWELAGLRVDRAFTTFPHGFPEEILGPWRRAT